MNEVVTLFEDPKFESGTEEEKRKLKEVVGEKMNEVSWKKEIEMQATK